MVSTPLAVERRQLHGAAASVYRVETRSGEIRTFRVPEREVRTVPTTLEVVETRDDAPVPDGEFHLRGHAAVFGRKSDDLGGFREVINPGAFKRVLDETPDVRALFNHDPNYVLGRTKSNTLDLREDPRGLHYYVRAADTSYARDLKVLMARGDVDQSSFAFSMAGGRERWEEDDNGNITRTIIEVSGLFDVSPVTYPAYPQADASPVRAIDHTDRAGATPDDERGALSLTVNGENVAVAIATSEEENEDAATEAAEDAADTVAAGRSTKTSADQADKTDVEEELRQVASDDTPASIDASQAPSRDEILEGARQRIQTARRHHIYPKK